MKVSFFKSLNKTTPVEHKEVLYFLDRIKDGSSKKIVDSIRTLTIKKERTAEKIKLPVVTFNGKFNHRSIRGLTESSGYSIIDIDGHPDVETLKEDICKDIYTFACWISPSGNGIKALIKIPQVDSNDDYKAYFNSIKEYYFNIGFKEYFDGSTADISRATFESYDKDLYLNETSKLYTNRIEYKKPEQITKDFIDIPLLNGNEIADRLMVWFRKRFVGKNRNSNLHSLARQFNAFGVDETTCSLYLRQYQQSDFREPEINSLIKSAYKYTSEYNTQHFEDKQKVKKLNKLIQSGKTKEQIQKEIDIPDEILDNKIDELEVFDFWSFSEKGSVIIDLFRFKEFLKKNRFYKYFTADNSDGYIFIRKDGNFIDYIERAKIKDFVMQYLEKGNYTDVYNKIGLSPFFFSKDGLSVLDTADILVEHDTKDFAIIYYKNKAVKVYKDKFELLDYDDLDGVVWKSQVINRNISLNDTSEGEFKRFIWLVSGEDIDRYYSLKSVLGYLLHSYKDRVKTRAIVFNDELISDVPNGGSGKGLINLACSYLKKLSEIQGKDYKHDNQFKFQSVSPDSQIIHFDDVKRNFNFEDLFNIITNDFRIEKKGKDPIILDFDHSPKITVSTNYTIKGEGGSFNRRVFELELSSFFNENYTPRDEFKHDLFNGWSDNEWAKFDNYMLRSIQFYLQNGLMQAKTINLKYRKLVNDTSIEFIEFLDAKQFEGERHYKNDLKNDFTEEYREFHNVKWFTTTLFKKWLIKYCTYKQFELVHGKSNGQRYFTISQNGQVKKENKLADMPF